MNVVSCNLLSAYLSYQLSSGRCAGARLGSARLGYLRCGLCLTLCCARTSAHSLCTLYTSSIFQLILILPTDSDQSLGLPLSIITLPLSSVGTAQNIQYNAFTMWYLPLHSCPSSTLCVLLVTVFKTVVFFLRRRNKKKVRTGFKNMSLILYITAFSGIQNVLFFRGFIFNCRLY